MKRQVPGLAVASDGLHMGEVGVRAAKHMNKLGDQKYMPATIQTISKAMLHSVHTRGVRAEKIWEHFVLLSSTHKTSELLMKKHCKTRSAE